MHGVRAIETGWARSLSAKALWGLASVAAAAGSLVSGWSGWRTHAFETALAGAWCGVGPHDGAVTLGHCPPCWVAAAAALFAVGAGLQSLRR